MTDGYLLQGRAVYGESIGVLVLNTTFPRVHGDIANARTFDFPVRYKIVTQATQGTVVTGADKARVLLPHFIEAAQELEREGVSAIATSCGFLSVVQEELSAAVSIPVATSSLLLLPMILNMIGTRKVGVVTANASVLSKRHLMIGESVSHDRIALCGLEDCPNFRSAILGLPASGTSGFDINLIEQEVVTQCKKLKQDNPELGAVLFECTNLPPYARAVQKSIGLPVFGITHLIEMLHQSGRMRAFDGDC
ncbi:aspartate/glutamate racemase family protein [Thalassospira sp. UBA1131]|uniref:aspartate/glutamate racemase family protein n=1 Tax=Thalassospira sp. UBA1131 TaxID=1947672 RepID=UPI0025FEB53F|nr:aspartate/glutamate racemase family protein [Thalassospira sp. UBA1131]